MLTSIPSTRTTQPLARTSRRSLRQFLLCGIAICAPAWATTAYIGSFATANNTVDYTITTDGVLGTLASSDIVSVYLDVTGINAFPATVASGGEIYAQDLIATTASISFDFQDPTYAQSCFGGPASPNSCYATGIPMIFFDDIGTGYSNGAEGFQGPAGGEQIVFPSSPGDVIATIAPEPGTLVTMLGGSMILCLAAWKRYRQMRRS